MELIQDEISEQIVESAKRLLGEKGQSKITVRDILKDLKLTNRVFYNRFHNIDEIMERLYAESISRVRESLGLPWDEKEDFWQHIHVVTGEVLSLTYESRQNLSQYIFEADSFSNSNFDWWNQEIIKLIKSGKEHGYIKPDLNETAVSYSIWCFIRGFNADAMARKLPREEALKQFESGFGCIIDGMKAKE